MASHEEIAAMLADMDTQLPDVSPIKSPKRPRDETPKTNWFHVHKPDEDIRSIRNALLHLKPEEPNVNGHSKYYESTPASLLARMASSTDQNHIWGSTRAVSTCFGQNLPPHTPRPPDVDDPTTREKTYLQTTRRLRPYNSNWKTYARIQNAEPISSQHYPELPRKPDPDQG